MVGGQSAPGSVLSGLACSLRYACADRREGRGDAPGLSAGQPGPEPVSMGARRQPRAPAPGPRPKVRAQHPGKVGGGGGGKMRVQSPVRGGGTRRRPPSCLPLLTCVLGGVHHPLPAEEGEGPPFLAAAFAAFKFPWGLRELLPPPCFHCFLSRHSDAGGRWESGRRHSQRTAAAASEASPKWPPPSRPPPPTPPPPPQLTIAGRRRGPSSREKQ